MLVDREGGGDVIGSENYFEGKVLILFLPPFPSRNKKTKGGEAKEICCCSSHFSGPKRRERIQAGKGKTTIAF